MRRVSRRDCCSSKSDLRRSETIFTREKGDDGNEDTERVFSKNGFGGSEGERIEKGKPRENTSEGA